MTAEFWQYDARIGRRWNVDPSPKEYESPYAAFANNPIWFTDPNGADTVNVNDISRHIDNIEFYSKEALYWAQHAEELGNSIDNEFDKLQTADAENDIINYLPFGRPFSAANDYLTRKALDRAAPSIQELKGSVLLAERFSNMVNREVDALLTKLDNADAITISANPIMQQGMVLHKNNNSYKGPQAVYQINVNGKSFSFLYKFGKADMKSLNTQGIPTRLANQLRRLGEIYGEQNVSGKVIKVFKNAKTLTVKKLETSMIEKWKARFGKGKFVPPGNKAHGTPAKIPKKKGK